MSSLAVKVGIIGVTIAAIVGALVIFRSTIVSGFTSAGQTIGTSAGGFLGGIGQGITESFSQFEFPSFEFPNLFPSADEDGGDQPETFPFGTEGGTVTEPTEEGAPPTATDPDLSAIQAFTLQRKGILESTAAPFSFDAIQRAIDAAVESPNVTPFSAAEDFRQATEFLLASLENPEIVGDEPIGFFNVFEDVAPLPLSQFAIDFFRNIGRDPELAFDIPTFEDFGA